MDLIERIETIGVPEGESQGVFRVETKDMAIWATKKLASKCKSILENERAAQEEIKRVEAWLREENSRLEKEAGFFNYLLNDYFLELRKDEPQIKSLKLPHGTLKMRKQQPEYIYKDEEIMEWAKVNLPNAIAVRESVSKTVVKEHIKATGEVVPGVEVIERPEKFSVDVEVE